MSEHNSKNQFPLNKFSTSHFQTTLLPHVSLIEGGWFILEPLVLMMKISKIFYLWPVKWCKKPGCLWGKHQPSNDQSWNPFLALPSFSFMTSDPLWVSVPNFKGLLWHLNNLQTSNISITWDLVRNANSQPTPDLINKRGKAGGSSNLFWTGDSDAQKTLRTTVLANESPSESGSSYILHTSLVLYSLQSCSFIPNTIYIAQVCIPFESVFALCNLFQRKWSEMFRKIYIVGYSFIMQVEIGN